MEALVSSVVKDALVMQIAHELENSNIYLRIASFCKSKNLVNLAKHFEGQVTEEQEHSRIIYKLLTDLGEDFNIPEIPSVNLDFATFSQLTELYVQREVDTTNSLREIMELASQQHGGGCSVVQVAMIDMISKQQAELDESTSMNDTAQILNEWWQVALWDAQMEG